MADEKAKLPKALTRKDILLETLKITGNLSLSCDKAGVAYNSVHKMMSVDNDFRLDVILAHEAFLDSIEQTLFQRAIHGVKRPVFYNGRLCGSYAEYSDKALISLLQKRRFDRIEKGERYRENDTVISGNTGINDIKTAIQQLNATGGQGIDYDDIPENNHSNGAEKPTIKIDIEEYKRQGFEPIGYEITDKLRDELTQSFSNEECVAKKRVRQPILELHEQLKNWEPPLKPKDGMEIGGMSIQEFLADEEGEDGNNQE